MAKPRVSGPSGKAKSYTERLRDFGGKVDAWLSKPVWTQFERLTAHYGSKTAAISAAISAHFREVFGDQKKK